MPENATGPLRRFKPQLILMVDAADLGLEAGEIQFVELDQVRGFSASSHSLPLSVLAGFMASEFNCEVSLFCVQPQRLDFEASLTPRVNQAVNQLVNEFESILGCDQITRSNNL